MTQSQAALPEHRPGTPYVDVLSWGAHQGDRILLTQDRLVLGRAETCDVRFDDPQVSPTHAALRRQDGVVVVQDLGSMVGTFVNGVSVADGREVAPGDVITLADVRLRFGTLDDAADGADAAAAEPASASADPLALFETNQEADVAAPDVGPEEYAGLVVARRADLLREVAATRARSRRLIWIGALLFVLGSVVLTAGALAFAGLTGGVLDRFGRPGSLLGWDVAGFPTGYLGWALAALGLLLIGAGVALHLLARWRQKRIDTEIPPPPPSLQARAGTAPG
ncbi:FHA domain-containing protein [Georgenia sp. SYP-B2076]|uniref:FHA domain-containing protein n=1 Tax=Georgenia sp. SYP-B2076 TaxID=2495881 RepID=UPI000F8EE05C|nr:FHA domain-containing protein [Georgenia sp. SYP-B2076]